MQMSVKQSTAVYLVLCVGVVAVWLLSGCHGGDDDALVATGRMSIQLTWPEPSTEGGVSSQLIPARSESVLIEVFEGSDVVANELLVRPSEPPWTTEAHFDPVPAGTLTVQANAYPHTDGSGVAQAAAQMLVSVLPGATGYPAAGNSGDPVNLALASTITQVTITPSPAEVEAESQLQLTATALDALGRTVLVPATDPFEWSVTPESMDVSAQEAGVAPANGSTPGAATVTNGGLLTGRSIGAVVVTAREKESQVAGQAGVAVLSQVYTTQWRAAPDSTWASMDRRIAVDADGVVHIPDRGQELIMRFDASGNWLSNIDPGTSTSGWDQLECVTMSYPADTSGAVYISLGTTTGGLMVRRVPPEGGPGTSICGSAGSAPGEFVVPGGMAFGPGADPTLYVTDSDNYRIQKFDVNGTYRGAITTSAFDATGGWLPCDLAADPTGNLYVRAADGSLNEAYQVEVFDDASSPVGWWGKDTEGKIGWHAAGGSARPFAGVEPGAFGWARGIATDAEGYVYVTDYALHRVSKLRLGPSGGVVAVFTCDQAPADFQYPTGIAVTPDGEAVYVCGTHDSKLRRFIRAGAGS